MDRQNLRVLIFGPAADALHGPKCFGHTKNVLSVHKTILHFHFGNQLVLNDSMADSWEEDVRRLDDGGR